MDRSRPPSQRRRTAKLARFALCCVVALWASPPASAQGVPLQLSVQINGARSELIGSFTLLSQGRLAATVSELGELGLRAPPGLPGARLIPLDELPGLTYAYDERAQALSIRVPDSARVPKRFDGLRGAVAEPLTPASDIGAVVNYSVLAAGSSRPTLLRPSFDGVSVALDGRVFSSLGSVTQTAILRSTTGLGASEALRLETSYVYSDQDRLVTYRAGDTISGALSWTRPIRLAGLQAQRNFALRPDIVTLPLPGYSGSAAVPSVIDVYVNSAKAYSQEVGPGPYTINNLPLFGSGTANVTVRDAAGHEIRTTLPFFASSNLLAHGLTHFSVEAGLPRLFYGTLSDAYGEKPVASATLRHGITDALTLEAHAEGGSGLVNIGGGIVLRAGVAGVLSAAAATSRVGEHTGVQLFAGYETQIGRINIYASTQRTLGAFEDLASVSAGDVSTAPALFRGTLFADVAAARVPRALDRVSISVPLGRSTASLSFLNHISGAGERSRVATVSWSRQIGEGAALNATAFRTFNDRPNTGFVVSFTKQLGPGVSATTAVAGEAGRMRVVADAAKPLGTENGSFGWQLHDEEGRSAYRSAALSYRSPLGRFGGIVQQSDGSARGIAEFEGSIVALRGAIAAGSRIDDGFALVETGAPGVKVLHQNRVVGTTDRNGRLLVPELQSYQRNSLSIDTRDLPLDAEARSVKQVVVPRERSGVSIDFRVVKHPNSALVTFIDADGKALPAGSEGDLRGTAFVIGYDGQAYLSGLAAQNAVQVKVAGTPCEARFDYAARAGERVVVGPVQCVRKAAQ